jgi:tripartite-type tricarboxylate transporter receptor subunit TctC
MRGLGVTAASRWRELPDIPTLAEQGFPVETGSWYGIMAPAGLPAPIARKLHDDIRAALQQPAVRDRIIAAGLDPLEVGSDAFRAQIAAELEKWTRVIREAGIKAE